MPEPSEARKAQFLRDMPNAIVATNRRGGGPQLTPNWFLWRGSDFLVSTAADTAKVANIRRDPHVSLCIDDPASGDYVSVFGVATIVEGDAVKAPTLDLIRKYRDEADVLPHWEAISREAERVILIIRPERILWRTH